ncbi:MAG: hypothetical protein H8E55_21865 [Pelagibacterales bacterium]|nr:hypothetical protein [Pelagibacterales bacterium]
MADYININGNNIPIRASDPSNPILGEIWYNSTTNTLKGKGYQTAAWATSGNLNVGRYALGNFGTPSAGDAIDGNTHPVGAPNTASNSHESYNGSTWTSLTNTPFAVTFFASAGTSTAGIGAGGGQPAGSYQSAAFTWDGSGWTSITAVPGGGFEGANLFGTQGANIFYGGGTPSGYPNAAFTGDGSSWTSGPNLPGSNYYGCVCTGTQTAAISIGGGSPVSNKVVELDGSTWTSATSVPLTVPNGTGNGVGIQTAAVYAQGTDNQFWNGTSWSTEASLPTGKPNRAASGGTQAGWFAAGGTPGGTPTPSARETSEYSAAGPATVTISSS